MRRARLRLLLTLGTTALLLAGTAAYAGSALSPGAVLDQSNASRPSPCRYTGWIPDDASSWAAQTFTAGKTGYLTDVTLHVRGNVSEITVAITSVDSSGAPTVGSPLATATIPFTVTSTATDAAISFTTPAKIEAGKQYAIVLSSSKAVLDGSFFIAWESDIGASFSDQNGTQCQSGAYAGGRAWGKGIDPPGADSDFFFATYVVTTHKVIVQKAGAGGGVVNEGSGAISCGTKCVGEFRTGQVATLTAMPDSRSVFTGWSGGCSGTGRTCSLTVSADATVTATFTRKLATLRVSHVGSGTVTSRPGGISCGSHCSVSRAPGVVVLTARPSSGWHFARWQGSCQKRDEADVQIDHAGRRDRKGNRRFREVGRCAGQPA